MHAVVLKAPVEEKKFLWINCVRLREEVRSYFLYKIKGNE